MPKLDPKLATVRIEVTTSSGEKLEMITAATAVVRQGKLRRIPLKLQTGTTFFFWQMPPGRSSLFVSAVDFYEAALFVDFVKGVNPLVPVVLTPVHYPSFPSFQELSLPVRAVFEKSAAATGAASGAGLFEHLSQDRKAAALNILAKMADTRAVAGGGPSVLDAVDHIYEFRRDRIHVGLAQNLQEAIEESIREKRSVFVPVSGLLHKQFPSGSYKTRETDKKGNLQLTFDARRKNRIKADADIDIYTDVLRHFLGEVLWNTMVDVKTNPFQVYGILVKDGTLPEYSLEA